MNIELLRQEITEALSWTLLHSLWQGFVIALLLVIGLRIYRGSSPRFNYFLCCLSLIALVAWMGITFFSHLNISHTYSTHETYGITRYHMPDDQASRLVIEPHTIIERTQQTMPMWFSMAQDQATSIIHRYSGILVIAWLLGICLFTLKWCGSLYFTQILKNRYTTQASQHWQYRVDQIAREFDIYKPVKLIESFKATVPMVIGHVKPMILIPTSMFSGLTSEQLEAIITHELAHIKNNDFLINMVLSALETILFYHPAYWYIRRIITQERENHCDDLAIEYCGDARMYAETLYLVETYRQQQSLAMALQGQKNQLLHRIRRICLTPGQSHRSGELKSIFTMGLLCSIVFVTVFRVPVEARNMDLNTTIEHPFPQDIVMADEADIAPINIKANGVPVYQETVVEDHHENTIYDIRPKIERIERQIMRLDTIPIKLPRMDDSPDFPPVPVFPYSPEELQENFNQSAEAQLEFAQKIREYELEVEIWNDQFEDHYMDHWKEKIEVLEDRFEEWHHELEEIHGDNYLARAKILETQSPELEEYILKLEQSIEIAEDHIRDNVSEQLIEIEQALSNIKLDEEEHDLELALHDRMMDLHDVQMSFHDALMSAHDIRLDMHDAQMDIHEEQMDIHHEIWDRLSEDITSELLHDELINKGDKITLEFKDDNFILNGKTLSSNHQKKYKQLFDGYGIDYQSDWKLQLHDHQSILEIEIKDKKKKDKKRIKKEKKKKEKKAQKGY